jgi:peroxiredoxin
MDEAEFGVNAKATAEARGYYQRIVREFSAAGKNAIDRTWKAKKAIEEIDRGFIGHEAPVFTAMTTNGESLNNAVLRDRATLLLFRSSNSKYEYEAQEYRRVYEKVADRDVTFVTVFCDAESKAGNVEETVEARAQGWLMVRDGRAISDAFYVRSWPSTVLIDKRGMIRQRNLRGEELEKAIVAAATE